MAAGQGGAAFPSLGIAKQRARPSGSFPCRCSLRHWCSPPPAHRGALRPSPPCWFNSARHHGAVHNTLRRPCAPNMCCQHGVMASNGEGERQTYVLLFTHSSSRLLRQAPFFPAGFCNTRKVRTNGTLSIHAHTGLGCATSGLQHQAFRWF